MARNLPTAILRFLARLARRQVTRALDDATLRDLADALAEMGQEELAARLGAFFASEDRRAALARALERADACARQRLASTPWHGPARQLPLRGLSSLLQALEALPQDDLDETRLRQALAQTLQRDWRATPEQARGLAELYLACLREALLEVETDALRTLGRSVLRTEAKVHRLEQALKAWQEKARREVRLHIQGAVEKSAIVIGDYNIVVQTIVEPVRRLPTDYATHIEEFLQAYLGTPENPVPFGGRDAALAELDAWLADAHTPYLLLTAPAGRGKSALLVRWLERVRRQHPGMAVVFVPVSIRYSTNQASLTFAALAAQLARAFGDPVPADPHTPAEVWKAIAAQYLRREPPPEGLLVVLDGLDEAADWEPDPVLFPLNPRPGLKVAVSARLTATRPRAADWRRALGWERLPVREMALEPLDRPGLQDVMLKMGAPTDELARKPFIVEELHRLTGGDPLLVRFYVEDLWKRREDALHLTPEDLHRLQPGYEGYFQSWWEYQHQLWDEKAPLRERSVREVLNLLATALGPLPKDALLELAHPEAGLDTWTLEEALRPLARFVVQAPEGYIFGHPKLGDFFFGRLARREQADLEARFLRWGAEVLAALEQGRLAPHEAPAYLVRYYRAHLARARAPLAAFRRLVATDAWARAWEALEGSYAGYLSDVRAVWERAIRVNEAGLAQGQHPLPALGLEIRCALIEASVHSLAARLPAQLPALLVEDDLWTPAQALAHLRQMPDEEKRANALAALVPMLARKAPEALPDALQAARSIRDADDRARALAALAPHLPPDLLAEALQAARSIASDRYRAEALAALAPHLPPELLAEALQAARSIEDATWRAHALAALAPHLPPQEYHQVSYEALQTAQNIRDAESRNWALIDLVPYLRWEKRRQVLQAVLQTIRDFQSGFWRLLIIKALSPYLPPHLLPHVLKAIRDTYDYDEEANNLPRIWVLAQLVPKLAEAGFPELALQAVRSEESFWRATITAGLPSIPNKPKLSELEPDATIPNVWRDFYRAQALVALAPRLPTVLLPESLRTARSIRDAYQRAQVLTAIAPRLPKTQRYQALKEALQTAHSIRDADNRAKALAALAPHLPQDLLAEALQTAQSIESDWHRARALAALAPHLAPEQRRQALAETLQAAQSTEDADDRAHALATLAPQLPEEQRGQALQEALQAARSIQDADNRAEALAALAPHLPPELLPEALQAVRSIESDYARAKALVALAPHLPEEQRGQALQQALQVARDIGEPNARFKTMAAIVPRLAETGFSEQAIQVAQRIEHERYRSKAMGALALTLAEAGFYSLSLQVIQNIERGDEYINAITALLSYLPLKKRHQILSEFLQTVHDTGDVYWYAQTLAVLAPYLKAKQRAQVLHEALQNIRNLESDYARVEVLSALALHLSKDQRSQAFREAFQTALNIEDNSSRAWALMLLIPHLHEALRGQALNEALQAARSIEDAEERAKALMALAPHLPATLRSHTIEAVLEAAHSIENALYYPWVLVILVPNITKAGFPHMALQAIQSIKWNGPAYAQALSDLAPHLSSHLLPHALRAALGISEKEMLRASPRDRARALAALAPRLAEMPRERLYPLWRETLPLLAARTRKDLLADLRALAPVVQALGGAEAVAETFRATQDVGQWWE